MLILPTRISAVSIWVVATGCDNEQVAVQAYNIGKLMALISFSL